MSRSGRAAALYPMDTVQSSWYLLAEWRPFTLHWLPIELLYLYFSVASLFIFLACPIETIV
jgi:hypothetical protein